MKSTTRKTSAVTTALLALGTCASMIAAAPEKLTLWPEKAPIGDGQFDAAHAAETMDNELNLGAMIQAPTPQQKFAVDDYFVWCGAPTKGADDKYHLFYSRWPVKVGFAPGWAIHSEIAYAVSDSPFGPFRHVNVALSARGRKFWDGSVTHNPNVFQKDGQYYLIYTGNYGNGRYAVHRNHQRVGMAVSEKPEGPWTRFDKPIVDVSPDKTAFDSLCTTNPAACVRPDGKILLIYKAVEYAEGKEMGGKVRYGAAIAERPEGPYVKMPGRIFEAEGDTSKHWMLAEDPFIWFSKKYGNRYYAVARDVVGLFTGAKAGIALFQSADGLRWEAAKNPKVLGGTFAWQDGAQSPKNIERPALLIENQVPVAFFGATDGYQPQGRISFNVAFSLKKP